MSPDPSMSPVMNINETYRELSTLLSVSLSRSDGPGKLWCCAMEIPTELSTENPVHAQTIYQVIV